VCAAHSATAWSLVQAYRTRRDHPIGIALGDRLAAWAADNRASLRQVPTMPPGIDDRPADVWEPLIAVADAAGGHWPRSARSACSGLAGAGQSREASLGIRLLTDLRDVFGGNDKQLPTSTILERLHDLDEAPWADLRGKPLDALGLSRRLSQYGIRSKNLAVGDHRLKGYTAEDLHDAWARYIPPSEEQDGATGATAATPVALVAPVADVHAPGLYGWDAEAQEARA
jgi:hypothetical protein